VGGKAVFESTELTNPIKLVRLKEIEKEWLQAYQLILFWSEFAPGATTEN
jgi:hypothetical protein